MGYEFVFLDNELEKELNAEIARADEEAGGFSAAERDAFFFQTLARIGEREMKRWENDPSEEGAIKRAFFNLH